MFYYLGVMQWIIKNFAWFFFKTMNVSGAEAIVAAASPFLGQGESACLVRPFVDIMTDSEIHLVMTSGKSQCELPGAYLTVNHLRILHHRWLWLARVYKLGCSSSEPYHGLYDEYSCFDGDQ
jgi:nucleoside permease NupC